MQPGICDGKLKILKLMLALKGATLAAKSFIRQIPIADIRATVVDQRECAFPDFAPRSPLTGSEELAGFHGLAQSVRGTDQTDIGRFS
jgi:hypothetical protein